MKKNYRVTMPDGSIWSVPVIVIARNRARYYAKEYDNDVDRSLREDTIPYFEDDSYNIIDWAAGNMDWADVEFDAVMWDAETNPPDYQEGWVNGNKEIV